MSIMRGIWGGAATVLGLPAMALGHGDDNVSVEGFFGPILGLLTFMVVVGVGKAIIRRLQSPRPDGLR